ncbi:MAG: MotA/TolQ/ExbB proton channel family protein, partial [Candidatus Rokuibacteriota bacterium]
DRGTRKLTQVTIEKLVRRARAGARGLCEASKAPIAKIFLEAMRWRNIALEDLERVIATSRQEAASSLKRGLWIVGTIGSLAPYIGLFGTVVGIIRAFQDMAEHGAGGFEVVAAGISEALVATGAGLAVAIVALGLFNYLQVRVGGLSATYARSCERFVQALLYVESAAVAPEAQGDHARGQLVPA